MISNLGTIDPNPLVLTSVSSSASMPAFELNESWMLTLKDENQQLVDKLSQWDSSIHFIEEQRDLLDLIVVEKCMTIVEEDEQSAILASPKHRDFYLLLQRKLKCMIKSCETLSTGMVHVGVGDMRAFCARTISEHGYNIFRETKVGFLIASAVQWAQDNFAVVPFVDTIGSVFQVIVTLKEERDRYVGLARVADFATMACLPHYGAMSLDVTIEKVARYVVRARIGSPTCKIVEKKDQFGKLKQLMIKLLAVSSKTPAKEQASKAADCAFAHIMKPNEDSVLFDVLNEYIRDVGLAEALVATILDISVEDLKQLEPFPMSLSADDIRPTNDKPIVDAPAANVSNVVLNGTYESKNAPSTTNVSDEMLKCTSISANAPFYSVDVDQLQSQVDKLTREMECLKRKEKDSKSKLTSEGGLMYADVYEENKDALQNLSIVVNYLRDQQMITESRLTNHAERLEDLASDIARLMELIWQQMSRREQAQFLRKQEEKKKQWEDEKTEHMQTLIVGHDDKITELKMESKDVWSSDEDEGTDDNKYSK